MLDDLEQNGVKICEMSTMTGEGVSEVKNEVGHTWLVDGDIPIRSCVCKSILNVEILKLGIFNI